MSLFERVKLLCEKRGISLKKMEEEVGFAPRYVYKWNNSMPAVDKVKAVADFFGVSIDWLVTGETVEVEVHEEASDESEPMKMLIHTAKGCTNEEILQAVKIIRALKEK